jgi:pimeloyl-ACP methyl ester carboxylesterase
MKKFISYLFVICIALLSLLGIMFWRNDISPEKLALKYAYPSSKFVMIDGISMHYRDTGTGTPILLIHGTGASLHTWDAWTHILLPHYRVISFDLPGFGLTGPDPNHNYQISRYSTILDSLVTKLKINRFHIAGSSLGGLVAWHYTTQYPDKIKSLNLIDAAGLSQKGKKPPLVFRIVKIPIISSLVQKITPRSIYKKSLLEVYQNDSLVTADLIERYYELSLRTGNRTAFVKRMNQINEPLNIGDLGNIKAPVLIQWGKEDRWISVANAYRFQKLIPGASLKLYDSGHVPMEENPEETAQDYLHFLNSEKEEY